MSKNIHDLSDEEFDDLFRESAEKSNIDFNPDAWSKMSQKLDEATTSSSSPEKVGTLLMKRGISIGIVLLLLITGSYIVLRKPSEKVINTDVKGNKKYVVTDTLNADNSQRKTLNNQEQNHEILNHTQLKLNETPFKAKTSYQNSKKTKGNTTTKPVVDSQKTKAIPPDKKAGRDNPANIHHQVSVSSGLAARGTEIRKAPDNNKSETKLLLPDIQKTGTVATQKSGSGNSVVSTNSNSATTSGIENTPNQVLVTDSAGFIEKMKWIPIQALSSGKHISDISLKLPTIRFEANTLRPKLITIENTIFKKGLNIRLAVSPDFSFIPSNNFGKAGNNWAAVIEYRANNRLSIQTGLIRSMKLYNALPTQYEWNKYWTIPSPIKNIDATCKMLDIPLNVRYDVSQKSGSRWFVSAGFTSYIMLKEEYRYNYENPADPNIKRKSWNGKTGAYPFSVLNLSAGYERQLFRRLTLQVEPFYKAPLGKVGYGKVRLATTGIFFSVKYPF